MEKDKREKLEKLINRLVEAAVEIFKGEGGLTIEDMEAVLADLPTALKQDVTISFGQIEPRR
jgi:hypothetical protein